MFYYKIGINIESTHFYSTFKFTLDKVKNSVIHKPTVSIITTTI